MTRFFVYISFITLASCSDGKLRKFKAIVQEANRFDIVYKKAGIIVPVPDRMIANFKDILTRNVSPEMQRKFINDVQIDIYKGNKRMAYMMVANGNANPFVNFYSGDLNFGFKLTYGIGQTIDQLYPDNSRSSGVSTRAE